MAQLVAFLRGINLGKRTVKMDDLRRAFAKMGFADARTLIASGNVLFDATPDADLPARIEAGLQAAFGFEVDTIIRSVEYLQRMVQDDPFRGLQASKDTKFYVYFLAQPAPEKLPFPADVPGDFQIIKAGEREIYAVAYRMANGRFGPGLDQVSKVLDKAFGKAVTNRNWNTILRLIDKALT